MPSSYYRRTPFEDFEKAMDAILKPRMEEAGYEFETMRLGDEEDILRLAISPAGSKYATGRKRRDALVVDLAPGFQTSFGPSFEARSPSGWSRVIGPEIWMEDLEAGAQFRSPIEALVNYMTASMEMGRDVYGTPQSAWEILTTLGHASGTGPKAVGGLLQYGPQHPEAARQDFAGRINVGFSPGMFQEDAWKAIYQQATQLGPTDPWAEVGVMAPFKGDDKRLRMRRLGAVAQTGEGGYDFEVLGLGKNAADALKRLNVVMRGGLRTQADLYKPTYDEQGRAIGVEQQEPGYITGMEDRGGYQWLNMLMPGESQRRAAVVRPGTYFGAASPISGSLAIYSDVLKDSFAWGERTRAQAEIRVPHMGNLPQAEFRFGIMREKDGEFIKQRDVEGYVLEGGRTAIIGTYKIPGAAGEEVRELPIKVTAEGRPMFFTGEPELIIPPKYEEITGEGHPGPEMIGGRRVVTEETVLPETGTQSVDDPDYPYPTTMIKKTVEQQGIVDMRGVVSGHSETTLSRIEKIFPGRVRTVSKAGAYVHVPAATMVAGGEKQAIKAAPFEITGKELMSQLPRVTEGEAFGRISAFTGELKSPLVGFMYEFGALPIEKMAQMAGEFGGETGRLLSRYITGIQQYAEEGVPNVPVDPERMAEAYAKTRGETYAEEQTVYQMFEDLRTTVEDLPQEYTLKKYGRARFGDIESAPWTPLGYVTHEEKSFYTREAMRGLALGPKGEGEGGMEGQRARQRLRQFMKFEPVYRTPEGKATREMPQVSLGEMFDPVERGQSTMGPTAERVMGMLSGETTGRSNAMERNLYGLLRDVQSRGYEVESASDIMRFMSWGAQEGINFANLGRGYKPMQQAQQLISEQLPAVNRPTGHWWSIRQPGLYATSASPATAEHMARTPIIGYEEMASLSMVSEDISREMGLSFSQEYPSDDSFIPKHVAAWGEIGEVYRHQRSKFQPSKPRNAAVLTQDLREQLQSALFGKEQQLTLEEMGEVVNEIVPGSGPLWNPVSKELSERPSTYGAVAAYRYKDRELQEPKTAAARRFPAAFQEFIAGGSRFEAGSAMSHLAHQRRTVYMSKSKTAMKQAGGRFVSSALGGRYSAVTGVGLNTAVITQERMDQMIRQVAGARKIAPTEKRMEQWRQQVTEAGGIPGVVWRSPVVSREYGALNMQFITPEIMKERTGIDIAEASRVGVGGFLEPGTVSATGVVAAFGPRVSQVIGDWDFDYTTLMGLVDIDPESGNLFMKGGKGVEEALLSSTRERLRFQDQALEEQVGSALHPLNVVAAEFAKMFYPGETAETLSTFGPEEAHLAGLELLKDKGGMGRYYNVRRLMESAGNALNLDKATMAAGGTAQTLTYQEYVDLLGKGPTNLETLFQTAVFGEGGKLVAMKEPEGGFGTIWDATYPDQMAQSLRDTLTGAVGADVAAKRILPSAAAFMFQMPGTKREDLISTINEASDPITGLNKIVNAPGFDITQTPVGLGFLTAAWGKTTGWLGRSAKQIELGTGEVVDLMSSIASKPMQFRGETIPVGDLGAQKDVALTQIMYQGLTKEGGPFTPEQGAQLVQEWQQRSGLEHVSPQLLSYFVNQMGLKGDIETMAEAQATTASQISEQQIEAAIPQKPRLRASHLAYMAYEPGKAFGGAYSEAQETRFGAQARQKMVAEQVLQFSEQQMNRLFPAIDPVLEQAGSRFEKQMIGELGPELSHMVHSIDPRRGFQLPLHYGGENIKFGVTPDVIGIDEEGYFTVHEMKASIAATEEAAFQKAVDKSVSGGPQIQAAGGASGFLGAANMNLRNFKKLVRPTLEEKVGGGWEDTATAMFKAIRQKGTKTYTHHGFQTYEQAKAGEPLTMLGTVAGGEFDWRKYAEPARPGESYPIGQAVEATMNLMTPAGALPVVGEILGRAQGIRDLDLSRTAQAWVKGVPELRGAGVTQDQQSLTGTVNAAATQASENAFNAAAGAQQGDGGRRDPPDQGTQMPFMGGGTPGGGTPDNPFIFQHNVSFTGGTRRTETRASREVQQALIAGRTLIGGGLREGRWGGFMHITPEGGLGGRAIDFLSETRGMDPSDITMQNLAKVIGETFGENFEEMRSFLADERGPIRELEKQYKTVERGFETGVVQKQGLSGLLPGEYELLKELYLPITEDAQGETRYSPTAMAMRAAAEFGTEGRAKGMMTGKIKDYTEAQVEDLGNKMKDLATATEHLQEVQEKYSGSMEDMMGKKDYREALRDQTIAGLEYKRARVEAQIPRLEARGEEYRELGDISGISQAEYEQEQDQLGDLYGQRAGIQARMGRAEEAGKGVTMSSMSRAMRRMIGGWGLFYLGHLAGFPKGQWQWGYQQAQQYGGAIGRGMRAQGEDFEFPDMEQRTISSQVAGGGTTMAQMEYASSMIPPGARDVMGAGMAGAAGYAGALFAGTAITPVAPTLGALATRFAGWIGVAATAASVLTSRAGYLRFPEQAQAGQIGTNLQFGQGGWWGDAMATVSQAKYGVSVPQQVVESDVLTGYLREWMEGGRPFSERGAPIGGMRPPEPGEGEFMQLADLGFLEYGASESGLPVTPEQKYSMFAAFGKYPGMAHLDQGILQQTGVRMEAAGITGAEPLKRMTEAQMAGLYDPQLAYRLLRAGRQPVTAETGVGMEQRLAETIPDVYERMGVEAGLPLFERLPEELQKRRFPGWDEEKIAKYMGAAGQRKEQGLWEREIGIEEWYETRGMDRPELPPEHEFWFGEERRRRTIETQAKEMATQAAFQQGEGYGIGMQYEEMFAMAQTPEGMARMEMAAPMARQLAGLGVDFDEAMRWNQASRQNLRIGDQIKELGAFGEAYGVEDFTEFLWTQREDKQWIGQAQRALMQQDPYSLTQFAMQGAFTGQTFQGEDLGTVLASMDISPQGQITGLPWGTTGMQRGATTGAQMGAKVWGMEVQDLNVQNLNLTNARGAAVQGLGATFEGMDVPEYMQGQGGMRALQWIQGAQAYQYQQDMQGIQQQQLDMQAKYQPQFWAIEDKQMQLQWNQAQWGFEFQQKQFDLQGSQFYEQMATQRTGQVLQRGWKQEDWAFQDLTRNMQWGWKQEDFQEQVRFMSGRERTLAERGMERETIMFNLEGGQIEKQRERQERLWELEDERHEQTLRHFEQTRELQEQNMEKQREFFEQGFALRLQQQELQRAYWMEQHELQQQSLDIQVAYSESTRELNETMAALSQEQEDLNAKLGIARTLWSDLIQGMINDLRRLKSAAGQMVVTGNYSGDDDYDPYWGPEPLKQTGGHLMPGIPYVVGDRRAEVFKPGVIGTLYPDAERFSFRDKWQEGMTFGSKAGSANTSQPIIINIGKERLGEYVLDTITNELEVV